METEDFFRALKTGAALTLLGVSVGFVVTYQSVRGFQFPEFHRREPETNEPRLRERLMGRPDPLPPAAIPMERNEVKMPMPPVIPINPQGEPDDPVMAAAWAAQEENNPRKGFEPYDPDLLTQRDIEAVRARESVMDELRNEMETGDQSDWMYS